VNGDNGILVTEGDTSIISNNVIWSNNDEGIDINNGSSPIVISNYIWENVDKGILVFGTSAVIRGNDIRGNANGINIVDGGIAQTEQNNIVDQHHNGIFIRDARLESHDDDLIRSGDSGLRITTNGNATLTNLYVENSTKNVEILGNSYAFIENSTFVSPKNLEMDVRSSEVITLNTGFNKTKVNFDNPPANLTVKWYANVTVVNALDAPIAGANVTVWEGNHSIHNVLTGSDGVAPWLVIREYEQGKHAFSEYTYAHTPNLFAASYQNKTNDTYLYIGKSTNITIKLNITNIPPALIKPIPDVEFREDTVATGALDLDEYFSDDGPLDYSFDYEGDPAHIATQINGALVDFRSFVANWHGEAQYRIRATDGHGLSVQSNNFTVRVTPENDLPVIDPLQNMTVQVGQILTFVATAADVDGDALTFLDNTTLFDIDPDTGQVTFTPGEAQIGVHHVKVGVWDGHGEATWDWTEFTITVLGSTNGPPYFTSVPPDQVYEGSQVVYDITYEDPDGDFLVLEMATSPPGAAIQGDPITGYSLVWTPVATGSYLFGLNLSDGLYTVHQNFTIQVLSVTGNNPPSAGILSPANNSVHQANTAITLKGWGNDPDGDQLYYSWAVNATPRTTGETASISLSPGTYIITLAVSDGKLSAVVWVSITVVAKKKEPDTEVIWDLVCWYMALVGLMAFVAHVAARKVLERKARPPPRPRPRDRK
jgi:hypothetical protein